MKFLIFRRLLLCFLFFTLSSTVAQTINETLRSQLVEAAFKYEGVSYRGGGTDKRGMDCSGLVFTVFSEYDIILPRSSTDMAEAGVDIDFYEVEVGDLLFFNNNPNRDVINHVGIVTSVRLEEIEFIHTSSQRGVMISSMDEAYHKQTFVKARRIIE